MVTETIKPLNYTVEAIKDLKFMESGLRKSAPYTAYVMRQVIDLLHNSPKFILPNCCDIIETDEYRQSLACASEEKSPTRFSVLIWYRSAQCNTTIFLPH